METRLTKVLSFTSFYMSICYTNFEWRDFEVYVSEQPRHKNIFNI